MSHDFKIYFYVPPSHLEGVKNAMFEAGAGRIGNYESCAWQTLGQGQYKPLEGSQPYYGQVDKIERVEEYLVEMICTEIDLKPVIEALIKSHPYETPAYGIFRLETLGSNKLMPLKGLHVLVTRPVHQTQSLAEKILKNGGEVTLFPTLEIKPTLKPETLLGQLTSLKDETDFFIFVSANAVVPGTSVLRQTSTPILAVGPATEAALKKTGLPVQNRPETEFSVEGLLKLPELQSMLNKKVVIFSGKNSNALLVSTLLQRGAKVISLEVYQRICPEVDVSIFLDEWKKKISLVIATSSEGLENFHKLLGRVGQQWLMNIPLLVISRSMKQNALRLKLGNPVLEARNATDEAIIEALENWSQHARESKSDQ